MLIAFGDSIAEGLGAHGESYPVLTAARLGIKCVDLTSSAMQLSDMASVSGDAAGATIALIGFGITEAIIRPTPRSLRFMPHRWRRPGWMDPRPYYSTRLHKRLLQRAESALRWRIKVALIRMTGGTRWGEPRAYEADLRDLVEKLQRQEVTTVVIIGHAGQDERFFPGSEKSCDEFRDINRAVAYQTNSLYLDTRPICQQWDDYLSDHFHPNERGHRRIAEAIVSLVQATAARS